MTRTLPTADPARARRLFRLSIGPYFMGGVVVTLVSLLVPRLKLLMGLDYARASLIQLAFHSSYLLFALPITAWLVAIGYMRGIALGLTVMVAGCGGLIAAAQSASYPAVLIALLLLAGGITFLQIAGNVVVAIVEDERQAVARMTFLQGFNAVGTVLAPLLGAPFLLAERPVADSPAGWWTPTVPFVVCALILAAVAVAFYRARDLLVGLATPRHVPLAGVARVFADPRLAAGCLAMFGYVGAEVTIGSLLANYLVRHDVLAVSPVDAGRLVSLYWGGAMIGRFAGSVVLRHIAPPRALVAVAIGAAGLVLLSMVASGVAGAAALIAVGLCNAIMYPTLFTLSLPEDPIAAPYASMALCMAVSGGAVVPVLTGLLADAAGLRLAFLLSLLCYLVIAAFALACIRRWPRRGTA